MPKKPGDKMHPKSLANLAPAITKENARELQARSAAKRKANNEARKALQLTASELKLDIDAIMDEQDISAIGVLKVSMVKALEEGDIERATEIAKILAEFEAPKLARVESKVEEITTTDLTDEELDEKLRQFKVVK